ncbi:MAG: DUF11 domain-containing protein [Dehalococcoidia bacterium]
MSRSTIVSAIRLLVVGLAVGPLLLGAAALTRTPERPAEAARAAGPNAPVEAAQPSITSILDGNGSLALPPGFSGSVKVDGYRLTTAADGTPRFVREDASAPPEDGGRDTLSAGGDANWVDGLFPPSVSGEVRAIAVVTTTPATDWAVYLGGTFRSAYGTVANRIVRYNPGTGTFAPLGMGLNGTVSAVVVSGTQVYVGGGFNRLCADPMCNETSPANGVNRIARYDTVSGAWSPVGKGFNDEVRALLLSGGSIFAGGRFNALCTTSDCAGTISPGVNGIARWNGTDWVGLNSGLNGEVNALAPTFGVSIIVGGDFSERCTDGLCSSTTGAFWNVATWNGTTWAALGNGINGPVTSIAAIGLIDYALGGAFNGACGNVSCSTTSVASNNVISLTLFGPSFGALALGLDSRVDALAFYNNQLYAGGTFDNACSNAACSTLAATGMNGIARYTGSAWEALAPGPADLVRALGVVINGAGAGLLVGGAFREFCANAACSPPGARPIQYLARFNGTTWNSTGGLGNAPNGTVNALAVDGDTIYIGGSFRSADTLEVNHIARYNYVGGGWSRVGFGFEDSVNALAIVGGVLFAGGEFEFRCLDANCQTQDAGEGLNRIAYFDQAAGFWKPLQLGLDGRVDALSADGNSLLVGGLFTSRCTNSTCTLISSQPLNRIARWTPDTGLWSPLGFGLAPLGVQDILVGPDGIYAAGSFTQRCDSLFCATSTTGFNRVARFDGTTWQRLGDGFPSIVNALARVNGSIVAGGLFVGRCLDPACAGVSAGDGIERVARWDGAAWGPLGNGLDQQVYALQTVSGGLFAGGQFLRICPDATCSATGQLTNRIARWDPSMNAWLPLGSGANGAVIALDQAGGNLFAGGFFTAVGNKSSHGIAQFRTVTDAMVSGAGAPRPATFLAPLTYTVAISNTGPGTAAAVVLTSTFNAGVTVDAVTPSQGTCSGSGPVVCTLGNLASGGSAFVTIRTTPALLGAATGTFVVSTTSVDLVTGNDSATAVVQVGTATPTPTATFPPGVPTFTPTPTATFPPGVPTFTPSPTATLAPGQTMPGFIGLGLYGAPLD